MKKTANMLAQLSEIVLTSNIFEFNGDFYIYNSQAQPWVPKCHQLMQTSSWLNLKKYIFQNSLLWKRYIDDTAIFTCKPEELSIWINNLHLSIKFTLNTDQNGILDN